MSENKTTKKKWKPIKCIRDWDDCQELQNQCREVLPTEHKWKLQYNDKRYRNLRRFQFKTRAIESGKTSDVQIKNESFIKRSFTLLNASEDENKEDFYIALHHFSQSILSNNESNGKLNKPLTAVLMTTMDNDAVYGCAGHKDAKNLVSNNFKLDTNNRSQRKFVNKYVQAPIVPRQKVIDEIAHYSNSRPTSNTIPINKEPVVPPKANCIIDVEEEVREIKNKLSALLPNEEYSENNRLLTFKLSRIANDILFLCKTIKTFPVSFKLESGMIYQLCMSNKKVEDCNLFQLLKKLPQTSSASRELTNFNCDKCKNEETKNYRREKSKSDCREMQVASDSRTKLSVLSPTSLMQRAKNLTKEKKSITQKLNRRDLKLKELDIEKTAVVNGDNIVALVKEVYNFCTSADGKQKMVATMISTMMREDVKKDKWNESQVQDFVDRFATTIKNKTNIMNGQSNLNRFDSRELRRLGKTTTS